MRFFSDKNQFEKDFYVEQKQQIGNNENSITFKIQSKENRKYYAAKITEQDDFDKFMKVLTQYSYIQQLQDIKEVNKLLKVYAWTDQKKKNYIVVGIQEIMEEVSLNSQIKQMNQNQYKLQYDYLIDLFYQIISVMIQFSKRKIFEFNINDKFIFFESNKKQLQFSSGFFTTCQSYTSLNEDKDDISNHEKQDVQKLGYLFLKIANTLPEENFIPMSEILNPQYKKTVKRFIDEIKDIKTQNLIKVMIEPNIQSRQTYQKCLDTLENYVKQKSLIDSSSQIWDTFQSYLPKKIFIQENNLFDKYLIAQEQCYSIYQVRDKTTKELLYIKQFIVTQINTESQLGILQELSNMSFIEQINDEQNHLFKLKGLNFQKFNNNNNGEQKIVNLFFQYPSHGNLINFIENNTNVPKSQLYNLLFGIAECLYSLEQQKVLFTNLNPQNILINYENENYMPYLSVFGIWKNIKASNLEKIYKQIPDRFASWEFFSNSNPQKQFIWSFGCICFFVLTGSLPWENQDNFIDLISKKKLIFDYASQKSKVKLNQKEKELIDKCIVIDPTNRKTIYEIMNYIKDMKTN